MYFTVMWWQVKGCRFTNLGNNYDVTYVSTGAPTTHAQVFIVHFIKLMVMEGDNNRPIFPLIRDVGDWHESGAHNKWNFSSKHSERGTLIAYQEYTLLLLFYSVEFRWINGVSRWAHAHKMIKWLSSHLFLNKLSCQHEQNSATSSSNSLKLMNNNY